MTSILVAVPRIHFRDRAALCIMVLGVIFLFWGSASGYAADSAPKKVLILHSYDPGFSLTRQAMEGMREVFSSSQPQVVLQVEYLDTKRYHSPDYLTRILDEVFRHKLAGRAYDLVLVSDNDAFNFALRHRHDFFDRIPIVFCGVNNFKPDMIAGVAGITGIGDEPSFAETIEVALRLHPDTQEFIFIGSTDNETGRLIHQNLSALADRFREQVRFIFWDDIPIEELTERLQLLPRGRLVSIYSFIQDRSGRVLPSLESINRIREASLNPLYGFWDFHLGHGIVGGKLVSSRNQGKLGAELALRVLRGERPETIPVISTEANAFMFDYQEMQRFGIKEQELPEGSQEINPPHQYYSIHKWQLWSGLGLLVCLAGFSSILLGNIASRRKAERNLRSSRENYRSLVEHIELGIVQLDKDLRIIMANSALNRLFPDAQEPMVGGFCYERFHGRDKPCPGCHATDVMATGKPQISERTLSAMGQTRILRISTFPVLAATGECSGLIEVIEDITEHRQAEMMVVKALLATEEAKDKIDAIVRSVPDCLIVADEQKRVVLMNQAAELLLGLQLAEVAGKSLETVISEKVLREYLLSLAGVDSMKRIVDLEILDRGHGTMRVVQAHPALVRNRDGRETGIIVLLKDVTRERDIDRIKNEFISIAAHELRTPLASILGYAELLLDQDDSGKFSKDEQREFLSVISSKGETLSSIVDDLLDLSRIQSGKLIILEKNLGNINRLLEEVVVHYRRQFLNHSFVLLLAEKTVPVIMDSRKIGQVLENLLSNAVKFSPEGGEIRVIGESSGDSYRVCVEDQGIGMSTGQVEKVFDKFYRADGSDTAVAGLGLGMSIAKSIVEAHGGQIWVESVLGEGTRAYFSLPLRIDSEFCKRLDESMEALGA